ncbi:MAG TPA: fluoride efflux transporter CrcB [Gaiellaceae bacterium]|jgi:Integral membrane protein possibly involved in chromosome condensation|nr:fluoride efflux transporter CrcB [Gaiellaceae bacterium]
MSVSVWVGVALLGGVGALLRFRLDALVQMRFAGELPLGTLVVNLAGSFCLGALTGLSVTGDALLLGGTALLGSFTTFSTWMLETERLGEEGQGRLALVNLTVSLGGGLAAALLGWIIGAAL